MNKICTLLGLGALCVLSQSAVGQTVSFQPGGAGNDHPNWVLSLTISGTPRPGYGVQAVLGAAPSGMIWYNSPYVNVGGVTRLWRTGGQSGPVNISWVMTETNIQTGVSTQPEAGEVIYFSDPRTPDEEANAARFNSDIDAEFMNGKWIVSGSVSNVPLADARLEYWSGAEWIPISFYGSSPFYVSPPFVNSGQFMGTIPGTIANPLIRVYSPSLPPGNEGWAHPRNPLQRPYQELRAPAVVPGSPPNRFNIRSRNAVLGVRG